VASAEGFEAFCISEHPRLVGMLSLYCGDAGVAEELAQDALAVAWRDWAKVQAMTHPSAWIAKVAINRANSFYRRRSAERRASKRIESPHVTDDPDIATAVAVRSTVAGLPVRQRTVLVLHYFMDLPFREVAETLGIPEPTVKSLARRAIAAMRKEGELADLEEAPGVI